MGSDAVVIFSFSADSGTEISPLRNINNSSSGVNLVDEFINLRRFIKVNYVIALL